MKKLSNWLEKHGVKIYWDISTYDLEKRKELYLETKNNLCILFDFVIKNEV